MTRRAAGFVAARASARLAVGLGLCALLRLWAAHPAYPGFLAGLLGALWLLAAWLKYLKSRGTDVFSGFRRQRREVPYFLRSPRSRRPRLTLSGVWHAYDDDLGDAPAFPEQLRLDALACLISACALLLASQFL